MLSLDDNDSQNLGNLYPVGVVTADINERKECFTTEATAPNMSSSDTEEDLMNVDPFSLLGKIPPEFDRGLQYILTWPTLYALF